MNSATQSAITSPETESVATSAAPAAETTEFEAAAAAVDAAVARLGELDGDSRAAGQAVKVAIEGFHRPGLVHIVQTLKADPAGKQLLFDLVDDPAVRALFVLHGIIKTDPMTRANQALESVRPYLHSHGGDVELVAISDGTAQVRLQGSCNGCSMSAVTLRDLVADALVGQVDEIGGIEVLEDQATTAFIPVSAIGRKPSQAGWVKGPAVGDLGDGVTRFDVDDMSFVITNVDQRLAVFRNACVHQGRELDDSIVDEGVLICPGHGFRFDASSGECISAPGAQLEAVPSRVEGAHLWVRARGN